MEEEKLIVKLGAVLAEYGAEADHQMSDVPYTCWQFKLGNKDYIVTLTEMEQ